MLKSIMADTGHLKMFSAVILMLMFTGACAVRIEGGIYDRNKEFLKQHSPYLITKDIEVARGTTLTIQAGVEVRFSPGIKLVVNGTLTAVGTEQERIKFTRDPNEATDTRPLVPKDIRLVGGPNNSVILEGRLQFNYKNKWRSVCTDFKNWTQEDSNVVCHHLGFRSGNFSFNFTADNETLYQYHMAYPEPKCNGTEDDMFNCPGSNILKIGWDICKLQRTLYIRCEDRLHKDFAKGHWHGINFYNSTSKLQKDAVETNFRINVSTSRMQFVDIEYGGADFLRRPAASLTASPYPPVMADIRVSHSAYHGMNFSEVNGTVMISRGLVHTNRGHGILVKSQLGRVFIDNTVIHHNGGDGIHMRMVPYTYESYLVEEKRTFCRRSSGVENTFPIIVHGQPHLYSPCRQLFTTKPGRVITLNVLEMDISTQAEGNLVVYDGVYNTFGQNYNTRMLYNVSIVNGTMYGMPQSMTSSKYQMTVLFYWNTPRKGCFGLLECMKFVIELSSSTEKTRDLELRNVNIYNNTYRGVTVENMRSIVRILDSRFSHNQYEAGIRIYEGAGDVIINNTIVTYNQNAGINITYSGGRRIINNTVINYNYGYGIFVEHVKVNRTRNETEQISEILNTAFHYNEGIGLRVGNYCREGVTVVNASSSFIGNGGAGVEFWSCLEDAEGLNNITMQWVHFEGNGGQAFTSSPMLNAEGHIWNCTFKDSSSGAIRIDNTDEAVKTRLYQGMRVNYLIDWNRFQNISGQFVISVRLNPISTIQKLDIMYNMFIDNVITQSFPGLNPRSKASGMIIASSKYVTVRRNNLAQNPDAYKLISTHLLDSSAVLDCNFNFFGKPTTGSTQEDWDRKKGEILKMIFDNTDRYNLAKIEVKTILRYDNLHTDQYPGGQAMTEAFYREIDGVWYIGGEVSQDFTAERGKTYVVDSDIHILDSRTFEVQAGASLLFYNSIGMLVQGTLKIAGQGSQKVLFSKMEEDLYRNNTNMRVEGLNQNHEGLVEVMIDDEWGTICNLGWSIQDAAIVCQSFGMTLDPNDWMVENPISGNSGSPILLANVKCDEIDVDILKCRADHQGEHSCDHTMDVNVKCKPSTWAGIRMPASAQRASLKHAVIEKSGLMDYAIRQYVPGIQIDFNYHVLEDLVVRNAISHGIGIMFSDPYGANKIERTVFKGNGDSGIVTRTSYLHMRDCTYDGNKRAGFEYNPFFSESDASSIRNMIYNPTVMTPPTTTVIDVKLDGTPTYIITRPGEPGEDATFFIEVKVDSREFRITAMILDYNPDTATEKVYFHLGDKAAAIARRVRRYSIEEDLVDFPLMSYQNRMTLEYKIKGQRSGRLALIFFAKRTSVAYPTATIQIHNSEFKNNNRGLQTIHYNSPSNERLELFVRYRDEAITLHNVDIHDNVQEAMYIPSLTKYHEEYMPSIDEVLEVKRVGHINYTVQHSQITENGKGILAEHNHVRFANNFWSWKFLYNQVARNKAGGFVIELPKVPDVAYELNISQDSTKFVSLNHSVDINHTIFEDNTGFEFGVLGFYTNLTIANNTFRRNRCKSGLIRIAGMEKYMNFTENTMTDNVGRFVIEFDIQSHAEFSKINDSYMWLNTIQNNQFFPGMVQETVAYKPQSYAVAIRGVSNITLFHNLFGNPDLEYELIADQPSSRLLSYLNVTLNWWGTSDQAVIQERIFDFDDWNNYGIARYNPYLLGNSFLADHYKGALEALVFDYTKPWKGRIARDTIIPYKATPYKVLSDVTVLPGVTLVIEPKVEILFRPNVGILILGSFIARGRQFERIRFGPMKKQVSPTTQKVKRDVPAMRLVGGDFDNEGFLQLFNETNKQWSLICDPYFNEKTAEVFCTDLGKERTNVHVRFTDLFEYRFYGNRFFREKFVWHRSVQCAGTENSIEQCDSPINYHMKTCSEAENFVFIRCGNRNLPSEYEYWGNIRFSSPDYELTMQDGGLSVLEYVDIEGAGILHGEKTAAVQSVYQTPITNNVEIKNCASNGFDFVSPRSGIAVFNSRITNNIGYGVGILGLNGESGDQPISSFNPLNDSIIPYNLFGLVRMCDAEKDVFIQDRILLYYKYEYESIDCVKVIRSRVQNKKVAIRFLQVNLFKDRFERNAVEVFDGDYFDNEYMLGTIDSDASRDTLKKKYESSRQKAVLSVHMHASPGPGMYGFIAEVVTLPLSPLSYPDEGLQHMVKGCELNGNQGGAIRYMNVGESNPSVSIRANDISNNGVAFMNLTSYPNIYMNIQNTRESTLSNNFIYKNKGGVHIHTDAASRATAYAKNLTNNMIMFTHNAPALTIRGHWYEKMDVKKNYIAHNYVIYSNSIVFSNISLNFSRNVVVNNTGAHIIDIQGVYEIADYQWIQFNGIHNNTASGGEHFRTTIYARNPHIHIHDNFLENWLNTLELTTHNRSRLDERHFPVQASRNWWGQSEWWRPPDAYFVAGKIYDRTNDYEYLIPVTYRPFFTSNSSVLDGKCRPGWSRYANRCYLLFGGTVTYQEATRLCAFENATLAFGRDRLFNLTLALKDQQGDYDRSFGAWIRYEQKKNPGLCPVVRDEKYMEEECDKSFPFICEHDPYGVAQPTDWRLIGIICGCAGAGVFLLLLIMLCWVIKSKQRKEQRLERRNSIRSSIRSSRSARSQASRASRDHLTDITGINGLNGTRRAMRPPANKYNISGATLDETSDSIGKKLPTASTPNSTLDYPSTKHSSFDNDLDDSKYPPRLENEIGNVMARPHYDMVFENPGYEDSFDRSRSKDSTMKVLPRWKASQESFKTTTTVEDDDEKPLRSSMSSFGKHSSMEELSTLREKTKSHYANVQDNIVKPTPFYTPPARLRATGTLNAPQTGAIYAPPARLQDPPKEPKKEEPPHYVNAGFDLPDYENSTLQLPSRATPVSTSEDEGHYRNMPRYKETSLDDLVAPPTPRETNVDDYYSDASLGTQKSSVMETEI